MTAYLRALGARDFRRLFIGASLSSIGDGMSFVALAWLVLNRPGGTAQLGLLAVCYTGPVFVGGWLAGYLLDRYDKRLVIAGDCIVRGLAFASVPVSMWVGSSPPWLVFVVAATFGLFKMVPLAGFPAAIPELVAEEHLNAANGLESLSYGISGIIGPSAAGLLIAPIGAASILGIDAATYFAFGLIALTISRPLRPGGVTETEHVSFAGVFRLMARDLPIASTTLAFMTFNIAEGMLLVVAPWLARERLGGATVLGLLLSAQSAGELVGAVLAGRRDIVRRPLRAIGGVELLASAGFLAILATPMKLVVGAGFAVLGFFSAPMTIWAQSMRMQRLAPSVRGRAFASLRTVMQATPPIGAAIATPLVTAGHLQIAVVAMVVLAGFPALLLLLVEGWIRQSAFGTGRVD